MLIESNDWNRGKISSFLENYSSRRWEVCRLYFCVDGVERERYFIFQCFFECLMNDLRRWFSDRNAVNHHITEILWIRVCETEWLPFFNNDGRLIFPEILIYFGYRFYFTFILHQLNFVIMENVVFSQRCWRIELVHVSLKNIYW